MADYVFDVRIAPGAPLTLVVFEGTALIAELPLPTGGAIFLAGRLLQAVGGRVDWEKVGEALDRQPLPGPITPTVN